MQDEHIGFIMLKPTQQLHPPLGKGIIEEEYCAFAIVSPSFDAWAELSLGLIGHLQHALSGGCTCVFSMPKD